MEKNQLLVTEALDEKALLIKKIRGKIKKAYLVDVKRRNEEKVYYSKESEEEFKKNAFSSFQQIMDLIDRYQKLESAIIISNAITQIETSYGTLSVAAAISLRNRLRECEKQKIAQPRFRIQEDEEANKEDTFEYLLERTMNEHYSECLSLAKDKNDLLQKTAENMRLTILGKESIRKEERPLEVVEAYIKENTMEVIDPLGVLKKIEELKMKRSTLLTELETKIKVSNATTLICL